MRCVLGWRPGCDTAAAIRELGARWILLEERFPYYNERAPGVYGSLNVEEPWAGLPALPWLTEVYHQGTTMVYRIDPAAASQPTATRTRPDGPSRCNNPIETITPGPEASTRGPNLSERSESAIAAFLLTRLVLNLHRPSSFAPLPGHNAHPVIPNQTIAAKIPLSTAIRSGHIV